MLPGICIIEPRPLALVEEGVERGVAGGRPVFGAVDEAEGEEDGVLGRRVSGHAAGGPGRPPARGPGRHSGVNQVTGYFVPVSRMRNHVS